MNPKKMKFKFKSKTKNFYAEPAPGNTGIRFMEYNERGEECIAMLIDNGKEFLLTSKNDDGLLIRPFNPTTQLLLKDGTEAPLTGEAQIEVNTPYGKKMIVRTLSKDNKIPGVIVAYEESGTLWSVAIAGSPVENLIISLAR